jgi:hypothetical protein
MIYMKDYKIRGAYGTYFIERDEQEISIIRKLVEIAENRIIVARIDITPTGVHIEGICPPPSVTALVNQHEMWREVSTESDGVSITIGDILRFGSYKVKVVDVRTSMECLERDGLISPGLKPFLFDTDQVSNAPSSVSDTLTSNQPACRICLETGEDCRNPLVSACNCSGSLRYIHVECLRHWLDGQLQVRQFESGGGSYYIRTILCEICKSSYSRRIYQSILIPRPNVPHVILEDFLSPQPTTAVSAPSTPTSKIHIIPIDIDRPIRIGRSKENDVVLSDISVSRIHGVIMITEDRSLKLADLNSKFGTLIRLPEKIFHPINSSESALRFQIGSAHIELSASVPSRFERIIPERFLAEKGSVKLVRSKAPADTVVEGSSRRLTEMPASPISPAATTNFSVLRSPLADDEHPDMSLPR